MVFTGNEKIAELLVEAGININAEDVFGCTAIHWSVEHGTSRVADVLIKARADLSSSLCYKIDKPFNKATEPGHREIFEEMLRKNGKFLEDEYILDDNQDLIAAVSESKVLKLK